MEIARKLSGATLTAKINFKNLETEKYLGRIFGAVDSVEVVETPFGNDADKFNGEFVCIRADGEQVTSPVCYLPPVVSNMTAKAARDNGSIKFGFDFYVVPSDKSKTGYTWKAQPLMEIKQSEALLAFAQDFPSLPGAAKSEAEAEPAKAPHKGKAKAE